MNIYSAKFSLSSSDVSQCPQGALPEYAFIGRSNVGKSSLINMLVNSKSLSKTSGKPGKTQLINHFLINDQWYMVDLPGYGYAQISKKNRKTLSQMIHRYFSKRKQLACAFVLIDIRHKPQAIDLEFMEWMGENFIPFSIIFTKADKVKPKLINTIINTYRAKLLERWEEAPLYFVTSAPHKMGREDLFSFIEHTNSLVGRKSGVRSKKILTHNFLQVSFFQ